MNRQMGRVIDFEVKGRPVPHPRPSVAARGGFAQVYYKDNGIKDYRDSIVQACGHYFATPWTGPLEVEMEFHFQRPRSHYNADRETLSAAGRLQPLPCRADVDNLVKGVLDAMNGLAYEDDGQVGRISAEKIYSDREVTKITLIKRRA